MSLTAGEDNLFGAVSGGSPLSCPDAQAASAWRERLYARFRGQPYPLFVFEEGVLPAASIWSGARVWSAAFRSAGLGAGDRIALALPPSPAFLYTLIAAFWNGLTLALPAPGEDVESAVCALDARASIGGAGLSCAWKLDACGLPASPLPTLRRAQSLPTPDARLLLATSGTTALPRWIALSDRNLLSVLDSHALHLNLQGARLLSTLPWHHAFGLVIDLLPAIFAGAEIVRDGNGGRDAEHVAALMEHHDTTHLNSVPHLIERLSSSVPGSANALRKLRGGIVGGAAVAQSLADFLASTRLRAGYGQTEASPGIALGKPGEWAANLLGHPVGCEVRLDSQGGLAFSGANACLGEWQAGSLTRLPPNRWVDTGDLARREGPNLYFAGRAHDGFKLDNGRWIHPGSVENALKRQFPQLQEILLHSPDGTTLHLLAACSSPAFVPTLNAARACLGPLGARLRHIQHLPLTDWRFNAKGAVRREQTLQKSSPALVARD